ncbi:MAG: metabolite traffic protein EboE [Planctomycetota bacterium]
MAISELPTAYCGNVHPGRTVDEVIAGVRTVAGPAAARAGVPSSVGLWLPRSAVDACVRDPCEVDRLGSALADAGLTCHTLNAFPYGDFHADVVKRAVYRPDWTTPERLDYTLACARLLARLLPEGGDGSISTLPVGYAADFAAADREDRLDAAAAKLVEAAVTLRRLEAETGRRVRLAIEPEPDCVLESTADAVAWFTWLRRIADRRGAADAVASHLGVCFDVCHQAVLFEDVAASVATLDRAGVPIVKVHLSNALRLTDPRDSAARGALARYAEPKYLHQTFARSADDTPLRRDDLSAAFCEDPPADWLVADEWRVHFHVPIDRDTLGPLATTRDALVTAAAAIARLDDAPHLEVETYTWGTAPLPAEGLPDRIAAELVAADRLVRPA